MENWTFSDWLKFNFYDIKYFKMLSCQCNKILFLINQSEIQVWQIFIISKNLTTIIFENVEIKESTSLSKYLWNSLSHLKWRDLKRNIFKIETSCTCRSQLPVYRGSSLYRTAAFIRDHTCIGFLWFFFSHPLLRPSSSFSFSLCLFPLSFIAPQTESPCVHPSSKLVVRHPLP